MALIILTAALPRTSSGEPPSMAGSALSNPRRLPGLTGAILRHDPVEVGRCLRSGEPPTQDNLWLAVRDGDTEIVRLLLNAGVKADRSGMWALKEAASRGCDEIVGLLLDRGDWGPLSKTAVNAADLAIQGDHPDCLRAFLDHGFQPDSRDEDGRTPLTYAAERGSIECVRELLAHGADVNASTKDDHMTPLIYGARSSSLPLVRLLVEQGANVNPHTESGWSPLLTAAGYDSLDIVLYLLSKRAALTANWEGRTPLISATAKGDYAMARALLAAGADVNARVKVDDPCFGCGDVVS